MYMTARERMPNFYILKILSFTYFGCVLRCLLVEVLSLC
jgi:hypothetical protein